MKTPTLVIVALALTLVSFAASAEVIDFRIKDGTRNGAWNTKGEMVKVKVGDVLRVHNDDTANHQLHTNGTPCGHGPLIAPGKSWDCKISREHDPERQGGLYDHLYGPLAEFWVSATK